MENSNRNHPPSAREYLIPTFFLLVLLLVPTRVVDFYPISSAPMFNEEPQLYCDYKVVDSSGQELPLDWFHLHRNDNGNPPGFGHGIVPKWSVDRLGKKVTSEEILKAVQTGLLEKDLKSPVLVEWSVIGDLDGTHIGIVETHTLRVERP